MDNELSKASGEERKLKASGPVVSLESPWLQQVEVKLQAVVGEVTLSVAEMLALKEGSVITLETKLSDLVEIQLNQTLIARGELVSVEDKFAVRVSEIAEQG